MYNLSGLEKANIIDKYIKISKQEFRQSEIMVLYLEGCRRELMNTKQHLYTFEVLGWLQYDMKSSSGFLSQQEILIPNIYIHTEQI